MGCGCGDRQRALNQLRPGLGDKVKSLIDRIVGRIHGFVGSAK